MVTLEEFDKANQQEKELESQMLEGEPFPDSMEDDSLQKLRKDEAFWSLAQQISQKLKLEKRP